MFGGVKFLDNTVNVVPMCWLKVDRCYWPNEGNPSELAKQMMNPNEDWPLYEVKIKFANLDTYDKASQLLSKYTAVRVSSKTPDVAGGSAGFSDYSVSTIEGDELADEMSNLNVSGRSEELAPGSNVNSDEEKLPVEPVVKEDALNSSECSLKPAKLPDNSETKNEDDGLADTLQEESENTRVLRELYNKVNALCVMFGLNSDAIHFTVDLPLKNKKDLKSLESYLKSDKVQECLRKKLSEIEGNDFSEVVRGMMKKLMSDDLAALFSWAGKKSGIEPFSSLAIKSVLIDAVKRKLSACNISEKEMKKYLRETESIISKWLSYRKTRPQTKKSDHEK